MQLASNYFSALNSAVATGWNRFWFTPARPAPLGALRILLGAISIYAIGTYGPDLDVWISPDGMLPKEMIRELYPAQWSILNYVPSQQLRLVHASTLVVLGLMTIGVGGRPIVVLSTALVLSYFSRAPVVTGEYEPVLAFLLVYLCIGRSTDAFSIQRIWAQRRGVSAASPPATTNAVALRLMQVHLAIAHLMLAAAQLSAPDGVWWSGEGIWLAAARSDMALLDLGVLADNHKLAAGWSHAIVLYLASFPILVWIPLARPLLLALGAAIWVSVAAATGLVLFCACMLASLISFLDSPWLNSLEQIKQAASTT